MALVAALLFAAGGLLIAFGYVADFPDRIDLVALPMMSEGAITWWGSVLAGALRLGTSKGRAIWLASKRTREMARALLP